MPFPFEGPTKEVGIHFDMPADLMGDEAIHWMIKALKDYDFVQMKTIPASDRTLNKETIFYMGNFLG